MNEMSSDSPQGQHLQRHDIQAVVQVFPEKSFPDQAGEVFVRCSHNPDIYGNIPRAA